MRFDITAVVKRTLFIFFALPLQMVLPGHPKTLIELADTAAPALSPWVAGILGRGNLSYPMLGNILIIDHFETSNITAVVLEGLVP